MLPFIIPLAATIGAVGSMVSAGTGIYNSVQNSKTNAMNYDAQMQALQWQKYAQNTTWQREDNAVQRRIADLKKAGLSPTLAAGSAASTGNPISISAPQRRADQIDQGVPHAFNQAAQAAASYYQLRNAEAQYNQTSAQTAYINSQMLKSATEADYIRANTARVQGETAMQSAQAGLISAQMERLLGTEKRAWAQEKRDAFDATLTQPFGIPSGTKVDPLVFAGLSLLRAISGDPAMDETVYKQALDYLKNNNDSPSIFDNAREKFYNERVEKFLRDQNLIERSKERLRQNPNRPFRN